MPTAEIQTVLASTFEIDAKPVGLREEETDTHFPIALLSRAPDFVSQETSPLICKCGEGGGYFFPFLAYLFVSNTQAFVIHAHRLTYPMFLINLRTQILSSLRPSNHMVF